MRKCAGHSQHALAARAARLHCWQAMKAVVSAAVRACVCARRTPPAPCRPCCRHSQRELPRIYTPPRAPQCARHIAASRPAALQLLQTYACMDGSSSVPSRRCGVVVVVVVLACRCHYLTQQLAARDDWLKGGIVATPKHTSIAFIVSVSIQVPCARACRQARLARGRCALATTAIQALLPAGVRRGRVSQTADRPAALHARQARRAAHHHHHGTHAASTQTRKGWSTPLHGREPAARAATARMHARTIRQAARKDKGPPPASEPFARSRPSTSHRTAPATGQAGPEVVRTPQQSGTAAASAAAGTPAAAAGAGAAGARAAAAAAASCAGRAPALLLDNGDRVVL